MKKRILGLFMLLFALTSCFLTVQEKQFHFGDKYVITLDTTFYQKDPVEKDKQTMVYGFGGSNAGISIQVFQQAKNDSITQIVNELSANEDVQILEQSTTILLYTFKKEKDTYIEKVYLKFDGTMLFDILTIYSDAYKEVYEVNFDKWSNSLQIVEQK